MNWRVVLEYATREDAEEAYREMMHEWLGPKLLQVRLEGEPIKEEKQ